MHTQVRVHAIVQIMLYDAHLPSDFLKVLDHFVLLCVSVIFRFQLKNLHLWLTRLVIRTGCRYIFVCPLFYVYIWYTWLLSELVLAVLIIKQLVVLSVVSARCKIYKHTSWLLSSSVFRVASTSSKATTIPQCFEMTYTLAVRSIHHCVISHFTVGKLMFFN